MKKKEHRVLHRQEITLAKAVADYLRTQMADTPGAPIGKREWRLALALSPYMENLGAGVLLDKALVCVGGGSTAEAQEQIDKYFAIAAQRHMALTRDVLEEKAKLCAKQRAAQILATQLATQLATALEKLK